MPRGRSPPPTPAGMARPLHLWRRTSLKLLNSSSNLIPPPPVSESDLSGRRATRVRFRASCLVLREDLSIDLCCSRSWVKRGMQSLQLLLRGKNVL